MAKWMRLKEFANGVQDVDTRKFYPFTVRSATTGISGKIGTRYFIKSVVIVFESLVTDAGTTLTLSAYQNGQSVNLAQILKTTLTIAGFSQEFNLGFLCDVSTAITFSATNVSSKIVNFVYAEIDDDVVGGAR